MSIMDLCWKRGGWWENENKNTDGLDYKSTVQCALHYTMGIHSTLY